MRPISDTGTPAHRCYDQRHVLHTHIHDLHGMPAQKLNIRREIVRSVLALPIVFVAVGGAIVVCIFVVLAVIIVAISPTTGATSGQQQKAAAIAREPAGRVEVVATMARCIGGAECPTDTAASDIRSVVAATSTVNGQSFTPKDAAGWSQWASAFNEFGTIQPDSVIALSSEAGTSQTVQVTTERGNVMVCQAAWTAQRLLSSWSCTGTSEAPEPSKSAPTTTIEPPFSTPPRR